MLGALVSFMGLVGSVGQFYGVDEVSRMFWSCVEVEAGEFDEVDAIVKYGVGGA